jgi:hypothetical protein
MRDVSLTFEIQIFKESARRIYPYKMYQCGYWSSPRPRFKSFKISRNSNQDFEWLPEQDFVSFDLTSIPADALKQCQGKNQENRR